MTSAALLAKRALAVPTAALRAGRVVPRRWVLTWHDLGEGAWSYGVGAFRDALDALARAADLVPLEEVLRRRGARRPLVALTFDDAYASVAEHAEPALAARGLVATVFAPTALLAEEDAVPSGDHGLYPGRALMGWRRVRALAARGTLRFASHGATHRRLPALGSLERRADVARSLDDLRRRAGVATDQLAYPLGAVDAATAADVAACGIRFAFGTRHGGLLAGDDPLRLPRVDVRAEYTPRDLALVLRGDWDVLALWQALRRADGPS